MVRFRNSQNKASSVVQPDAIMLQLSRYDVMWIPSCCRCFPPDSRCQQRCSPSKDPAELSYRDCPPPSWTCLSAGVSRDRRRRQTPSLRFPLLLPAYYEQNIIVLLWFLSSEIRQQRTSLASLDILLNQTTENIAGFSRYTVRQQVTSLGSLDMLLNQTTESTELPRYIVKSDNREHRWVLSTYC